LPAPTRGAPFRGLGPMRSFFLSLTLLTLSATPAVAWTPDAEPAPKPPADEPAPIPTPVEPAPEAPGVPKADVPGPKAPLPTEAPAKPADVPELRAFDVPVQSLLRFEHHGLFRFRPEMLFGGDLGPGASAVPEPLGLATGVDPDASALTWASMRLRYEPTMFIGAALEIHLGLDAFDNYVLGSHPAAAGRPDLVTDLLGDSQSPPSSGDVGWKDALIVREAWMRWNAFDTVDLRAGRMADHYGLGIYRNGGDCEDCDYGTIVDRVGVGFTVSGFRIEAAWEFTAVGATTDLAFATDRAAGGQAKDLGQEDDVSTYVVKVGRFPVTLAELTARAELLDDKREWAVDWSIFSAFIDQPRSSSEQIDEASVECAAQGELANGQPIQGYDCIRLFQRDAFFWRPGLWLKAEGRPSFDESIRFELELAGVFGEVTHPQRLLAGDDEISKTFQGLGLAVELEWHSGALGLGLGTGFATGDDGEHIGVLDGQDVVDPDDDAYATNDALRSNKNITSFFFNRDYHIDQILFRQVIGAVTNAAYFKPWVSAEVLRTDDMMLTVRFDALYALAMRPSGTPGDGNSWGLELDAKVMLDLTSGFNASLAVGLLVPLDALDNATTGQAPDPAGAVRALLGWKF